MKKRFWLYTLLAVLLFLTGVQVHHALFVNRYEWISMAVVDGSAHAEGVTIEVINENDAKTIYCGGFSGTARLQKRVMGAWVPLWRDFTAAHTQEGGPQCEAGEPRRQELRWRGDYGTKGAGHYRVIQVFHDSREPGDYTKFRLSAEFDIP